MISHWDRLYLKEKIALNSPDQYDHAKLSGPIYNPPIIFKPSRKKNEQKEHTSHKKTKQSVLRARNHQEIRDWLLSNCQDTWDETRSFCCMIPINGTKGIDFATSPTGKPTHTRFSLRRKKILSHEFIKNVAEGGNKTPDGVVCSHRCHNGYCLNQNHIVYEAHLANMNRIGCLGFIFLPNSQMIKACTHDPCCLKTTHRSLFFKREFQRIKE
jgi:hypothetical protein